MDLENFFRIHKMSSFLEQNSKPGKDTFYLGGSLVINLTAIREKIKAMGLDP
jgi:hypothetical protein